MVLLRPCATAAGFTATPETARRVDMGQLQSDLRAAGYTIVVDARVVLIIRDAADVESSVYGDGKVLIKTADKEAAQQAYDRLRPTLEQAWS